MQDNQRQSHRLVKKEKTSIQILTDNGASIVDTETMDISATGIRIFCELPVCQGMIHEICIEVDQVPQRFLLMAEIKWTQQQHNGFIIGMQILDAEGYDNEEWFKLWEHSDS